MFRSLFRFQLWIMSEGRFGFFVEFEVERESGGEEDVHDDEIEKDVDNGTPLDEGQEVKKVGEHHVT